MIDGEACSKRPAAPSVASRRGIVDAQRFGPYRVNLDRLDLVSLSLFSLVVRTGIASRGAELAHRGGGAASKRISDRADVVGAELC